ncbi:sialoadhesin-like, partial [Silurus asotus]
KPVVKIHPAVNVFIGETVTLTCDIQTEGSWKYHWNRSNEEFSNAGEKMNYTITDVKDSNKGPYSCKGTQSSDPKYTQSSDAVTLSVAESPKPVLSFEPDKQMFRGEKVMLRCDLQTEENIKWTYDWFRNDYSFHPYQTTQDSSSSLDTNYYPHYNSGKYSCRGRRSDSHISNISDPVTLTVSESPKPVVIIKPDTQGFRGETVIFRCEIQRGRDTEWRYDWYEDDNTLDPKHTTQEFSISSVPDSSRGKYTCRGRRHSDHQISKTSDSVTLTVSESPKPVVKIQPDTHVFMNERVTFRCEFQGGGDSVWIYDWYRDDKIFYPDHPHHPYPTTQEFSISYITHSYKGKYTCSGRRHSDNQISKTSDSVTLTVSVKPTLTVSVKPQSSIYTGDTVTLNCNLQSTGWRFSWYKGYWSSPEPQNTNPLSVRISNVGPTTYYCKALRGNYESEFSAAATVTVKARPKPVVKIHPAVNVFIGETVTLTCDIQTGGSWKYHWYRSNEEIRAAAGEKTYTITDVKDSNKGAYRCEGTQSSDPKYTQSSDAVTLSVAESPKPVVKIQPDTHVFMYERVTFRCEFQGEGDSLWIYDWYRDDKTFYTYHTYNSYYPYYTYHPHHPYFTTQEFSISPITDSSRGEYTCRGRRRSDNQISQTSDSVTLTVSEKPTPTVSVTPQSSIYTGDTVTLNCNLQSTGWSFSWYKGYWKSPEPQNTNPLSVIISHEGQTTYYCKALRGDYESEFSAAATVTVKERPKPVVKIHPAVNVFIGETVTLTCDIQTGGSWKYHWNRSNEEIRAAAGEKTYTITDVKDSNKGPYSCKGTQSSDPKYTQSSDAVTLTVAEKPEPELTSDLKGAALTGNSVVLYCTLKLQSAGWKFYWSKDTQRRETETKTGHFFFSSVSVSDGGQYWCRAGRGNPVYYTQYSDALWVNVTGESPRVSLIINPSRSQHFIADSLSLSCEDQRNSTGWIVRRYTHNETMFSCSVSTCNISSLSPSHTGVYWCQSESGERSKSVNITVHNGDVILDSPVHPVTEGNPLTLHCLYRNTKISTGIAFYRNYSVLQDQTTGVMTISSVSKSDEGFYYCKHPERGESVKNWISVSVSPSGSSGAILGLCLALVFVIIIIALILLLRYRKKK